MKSAQPRGRLPHTLDNKDGGATVSTGGWKRGLHVEVDRLAS